MSSSIKTSDWPAYYRGHIVVFCIFLGYVVWWYLEGNYRFPALGAYRFEFVVGATLSAFAIPTFFRNPNRVSSGLALWVSLLFLCMVVMVPLSYVPDTSWDVFMNRVVKYALFGLFIAAFVSTPERLGWFIAAFLFACLKMGQEGLVGTISGGLIWENQGVPRLHGATPMYGHPNSFSGMALGTLPFILYFYRLAPRNLRIVLAVQLFLSVFVILYTGSRTGYVGLFLGLVALVWKAKRPFRVLMILIAIGAAASPFIPEDYVERAQTIFTQKEKEGHSAEARELILEDGLKILEDNPFGVGVYGFRAARIARFNRDEDPHNLYLEIATNLGIQGLIVFLCLIGALLRRLATLGKDFRVQIKLVEIAMNDPMTKKFSKDAWKSHLRDLEILDAACHAVYLFVFIRLALGLFGHDLYEIYWWFSIGLTIAIGNLNLIARSRTRSVVKVQTGSVFALDDISSRVSDPQKSAALSWDK